MNYRRVPWKSQNGRLTYRRKMSANGYDDSKPQIQTNAWTSTENSSNNAWNVNFGNGNVNTNNNKGNQFVVRPVSASCVPQDFLDSVTEAYRDCCKGKMSSRQCVEYLDHAAADLPVLARELWTGSYHPGTSTCFLVSYPKWREVFAADFRDRIVHHWVFQFVNPLFEARFEELGNVSYNCRKGYGTTRAVQDAERGMARVSANYSRKAYVFRGDLAGFFMSIDKDLMWSLMRPFLSERLDGPWKTIILETTRKIIYHHPEGDCVLNTDPSLWKKISGNKSLFRAEANKGMPIGNLTTQIFANFYLSFFDAYVQEVFAGRNYYYIRFVDDFLICCDDEFFLLRQISVLSKYLADNLCVTLHRDKHYYQPVSHGVQFLGAYIKPHRTYVGNRTRARMIERVHGFNSYLQSVERPDLISLRRMETVLNSYLGFTHHHKAYKIRRDALRGFSKEFYDYFYIRRHHQSVRLKSKFRLCF